MYLTLEKLLEDPTTTSFQAFSSFVHRHYCTENLFFWHAVQAYEKDFHDQPGLSAQCLAIVRTYVEPNSPLEINIPCDMREHILHQVYQLHQCHPHIFQPAGKVTLELMRVNAFLPWLAVWEPSALPTPPTPLSTTFSACSSTTPMVHSVSSPQGWSTEPEPRASFSSFRSAKDPIFKPRPSLIKKIKTTLIQVTSAPTRPSAIFLNKSL
ncbi:regulator of G protein signaling superfamily [Hesseltinella vesiculosa]|uniref:Regulator of G protein signaling superfamily n=1 Tax=Hesseltinella vesiculosa TaxID=101127 RepID=A0A1X2GJ41_9FUNG|nr:regulator of G protein signaling superfamily [Hesseltinella vesiculosa]